MVDGMTLQESIVLEINKVKAMDNKKRWEYFKTYYLAKTVIAFIVFGLLLHLAYSIWLGCRDVLASGCFINVEISEEGTSFLTNEYVNFCGKTDKEAVANVSLGNTFSFFNENPLDNSSYEMALLTQINAGEYQYMILDEMGLERFAQLDIYVDLEEMLTDMQKENLDDRIVYQSLPEREDDTASAIRLSDTEFAKKYKMLPQEAYLVFIDIEQDVEKNRKFIDYIFEEFGK